MPIENVSFVATKYIYINWHLKAWGVITKKKKFPPRWKKNKILLSEIRCSVDKKRVSIFFSKNWKISDYLSVFKKNRNLEISHFSVKFSKNIFCTYRIFSDGGRWHFLSIGLLSRMSSFKFCKFSKDTFRSLLLLKSLKRKIKKKIGKFVKKIVLEKQSIHNLKT